MYFLKRVWWWITFQTPPRKLKIERRLAGNGEYYYVLLGGNGEVMLTSETYDSKYNCERARLKFFDLLVTGVAELTVDEGAE